jgi:hypothetical protein
MSLLERLWRKPPPIPGGGKVSSHLILPLDRLALIKSCFVGPFSNTVSLSSRVFSSIELGQTDRDISSKMFTVVSADEL